jgi:uncharacterized protein YqgC (DUF456 family)
MYTVCLHLILMTLLCTLFPILPTRTISTSGIVGFLASLYYNWCQFVLVASTLALVTSDVKATSLAALVSSSAKLLAAKSSALLSCPSGSFSVSVSALTESPFFLHHCPECFQVACHPY